MKITTRRCARRLRSKRTFSLHPVHFGCRPNNVRRPFKPAHVAGAAGRPTLAIDHI
jgi:hypothetical protein